MTHHPHRQIPFLFHWLAGLFLRVLGWRVEGTPPPLEKYVVIIAPHTSHWDAFVWMALLFHVRLKVSWLAKSSIFIGPWGWFLGKMGGIPVTRDGNGDTVAQSVEAFETRERFVLGLAPEGTRAGKSFWRSGFYEIAQQAGVPVLPVSADYKTRRAHIGAPVTLSGNQEQDLEIFRDFYAGVQGKIPGRESEITFRHLD